MVSSTDQMYVERIFVLSHCLEIPSCVLGRKCQLHSTLSSGVYSINIEDIFALEELSFNETRREKTPIFVDASHLLIL